MAKKIVRVSWYQIARLLKVYQHGKTVLEREIESDSEWAIELEKRVHQMSGYGYYHSEYTDEESGEYFEEDGFAIPSTRVLVKALKEMFLKVAGGNKIFLPVDENLVQYIPQDPPKKRWHQIDRCHRKWGWGVA